MPLLLKLLLGVVIGALLGFLYYKVVGCPTGACPLTKTPLRSTIYGAFLGLMVAMAGSSTATNSPSDITPILEKITAEQAKAMIDSDDEIILLDVRTLGEYNDGHIVGARLLPDTEVAAKAETMLTDKTATILVYCRSGRRSALAAQALHDLGYTTVYDFGGINSWSYDAYIVL